MASKHILKSPAVIKIIQKLTQKLLHAYIMYENFGRKYSLKSILAQSPWRFTIVLEEDVTKNITLLFQSSLCLSLPFTGLKGSIGYVE